MLPINKKYLIDENNEVIAVQLDIDTFRKIEQILEDLALGKLIEENDEQDNLNLNEAQDYYNKLKRNNGGSQAEPCQIQSAITV